MDKSNKGHDTQKRDSQGQFTNDRDRNASDRGAMNNQRGSNSGRQDNSSQSSQHMSEIGRKGGQR